MNSRCHICGSLSYCPLLRNPGFSYWDTPFLIFFRWFSGPNFWWNFCGFWTAAWPWCTAFLSFKWDDVLRIRISSTCARRLWTPWKSCLFAGIGGRSTSPVWNHRQTIFPGDILFALKGYEVVEFDGWSFGSGHIMKSHGQPFPICKLPAQRMIPAPANGWGYMKFIFPVIFFGWDMNECHAKHWLMTYKHRWVDNCSVEMTCAPWIFLYRFNLRLPYELQHRYCTSSIQHV